MRGDVVGGRPDRRNGPSASPDRGARGRAAVPDSRSRAPSSASSSAASASSTRRSASTGSYRPAPPPRRTSAITDSARAIRPRRSAVAPPPRSPSAGRPPPPGPPPSPPAPPATLPRPRPAPAPAGPPPRQPCRLAHRTLGGPDVHRGPAVLAGVDRRRASPTWAAANTSRSSACSTSPATGRHRRSAYRSRIAASDASAVPIRPVCSRKAASTAPSASGAVRSRARRRSKSFVSASRRAFASAQRRRISSSMARRVASSSGKASSSCCRNRNDAVSSSCATLDRRGERRTASSPNWADTKPSSSSLVRPASSVATNDRRRLPVELRQRRRAAPSHRPPPRPGPSRWPPVSYGSSARRLPPGVRVGRRPHPAPPTTASGSTKSRAPVVPAPPTAPGSAGPGVIAGAGTGAPASTAA
ncbi:hypothetical protein STANM309S_06215 [Streptomyces tanashiensis]